MTYLLLTAQSGVLAASSQPFTIDTDAGIARAADEAFPAPAGAITADGGSGADFLLMDHAKQDFIFSSGTPILPPPAVARRRAIIASTQAQLLGSLPAQITYQNTAPFAWQGSLLAPHNWPITDATHITILKLAVLALGSLSDPGLRPWPANVFIPDATGANVIMTVDQAIAFSYAVAVLIVNRNYYGAHTLPLAIAALHPANDGEVSAKFNAALNFNISAGWPTS